MRWETESIEQRNERMREWHEWFAWKPVHTKKDGTLQWVWLEKIYRRRDRDIGKTTWQYCFDDFEMIKLADEEAKIQVNHPQYSNGLNTGSGTVWITSGNSGHSGVLGGIGTVSHGGFFTSSTPVSPGTLVSQKAYPKKKKAARK